MNIASTISDIVDIIGNKIRVVGFAYIDDPETPIIDIRDIGIPARHIDFIHAVTATVNAYELDVFRIPHIHYE